MGIAKYGLNWDDSYDHLKIEMFMIRRGGQWTKDGKTFGNGLSFHYEAMRKLLWPHLDTHRWHELCRDEIVRNKVTVLMGPGCVHGDTRILNPITGDEPTIRFLFENQIRPTVMTLDGPKRASIPFIKGTDDLFEVVLENGTRFKATDKHLVLTERGFVRVGLLRNGECLFSYAPIHQQSTSELCPSIHGQDEVCSPKKAASFQSHCSAYFRRDDAQLLSAIKAARLPVPSQAGVQKYKACALVCLDDLVGKSLCNHFYPQFARLSNWDAFRRRQTREILASHHSLSEISAHGALTFRSFVQSRKRSNHHCTSSSPSRGFSRRHFLYGAESLEISAPSSSRRSSWMQRLSHICPQGFQGLGFSDNQQEASCSAVRFFQNNESSQFRVSVSKVVSIANTGKDTYFDLHVPGPEHYFAEGSIHHNSSGKTHEASWIYLCEYLCWPYETLVMVSSTDMRGLRLRVWGEISDLWQKALDRYDYLPGHLIDSRVAITTDSLEDEDGYDEDRRVRDMRKGIVGIPTVQGNKNVGLAKWQGCKQKRVRLIADEAALMSSSFLSAFSNLNKNVDFRAVVIGNPVDTMDPLGCAAEPKDGWGTETMDVLKTSVWDTKFLGGRCVNLIGTDSPNFDYPDGKTRFPYLISKEKIDETLSFFPKDSVEYYSQCIGSMKISLMAKRIITRLMCKQFGAMLPPQWKGTHRIRIASLDAAYGGDRCMFGWGEFGDDINDKQIIAVNKPVEIPILVGKEEPEEQIAKFVKRMCEKYDIPPENFFHDSTGRGSLGTALARAWSASTNPVEFGGKPTNRPVSLDMFIRDADTGLMRLKLACEHYYNFVTELWYSVRYTIEAGQMRNLSEEVMDEGCKREWESVPRAGTKVIQVEPKEEMKLRTRQSPDQFDCFVGDTLIATPHGQKRIDAIRVGDSVLTPFGESIVCIVHESEAATTKVTFSDGQTLEGKGKHRVFTWDNGWVRLDELSIANECESIRMLPLWHILNLLFTKEKSTGFKVLVDIIREAAGGELNRLDFYTELFMSGRMAQLRKVFASITKMATGLTIRLAISKLCRFRSTVVTICENCSQILRSLKSSGEISERLTMQPALGIQAQKVTIGTAGNRSGIGQTRPSRHVFARDVKNHSNLTSKGLFGARSNAPMPIKEKNIDLFEFALSVVRALNVLNSPPRTLAPLTVGQSSSQERKKVYNLTLEKDNVYYANEILVQNCLVILVEGARQRGFQISKLANVAHTDGDDDIDDGEQEYKDVLKRSLLNHALA